MPFTVSHAAAVLPLKNSRLPLAALMVGSMSPDFAYFLPAALSARTASHSLPGIFLFCLPAGLCIWQLFVQRNPFDQPFELSLFDGASQHADETVPAMHRHVIHHVLVDELVPVTHARLARGICRSQWWRIGKRVLEVFVDDGRVRDDDAVVVENRNLPLGIDREERRVVLLELVQVDVHALELEALFLEGNEALERVGTGLRVVELEQRTGLHGK